MQTGYKHTDIGIIPNEWEVKTLGEVSEVIGGGTPSTFISKYWNGNINWFTPTEVGYSKYLLESERKITELGFKYVTSKLLPIGAILLTTRAGIGDVGILTQPACTNQGFQSLVSKSNCFNEFLYYLIQTKKNILLQNASGSTFLEISPNKIKKLQIPIPPLPEQQAIAQALSDTDALITNLQNLIAKKRLIKQGAMQELLTPKKSWEMKKLGDACKIIMGQSPLSEYYNNESIGLPLIQGNADIENRKTIIRNYTSVITKRANIGSIIMSVRAPVGEIAIATFNCCIGRGVCSIEYKNNFIYHYLIFIEKNWAKHSTGSTFDSITSLQVKDLEIHLPTENEQTQIATILTDMDNEINSLTQKLEKYKSIKQGMMQDLLTGKVRLV